MDIETYLNAVIGCAFDIGMDFKRNKRYRQRDAFRSHILSMFKNKEQEVRDWEDLYRFRLQVGFVPETVDDET